MATAHEIMGTPVVVKSLKYALDRSAFPTLSTWGDLTWGPGEVVYASLVNWHSSGLTAYIIAALFFYVARLDMADAVGAVKRMLLVQVALALAGSIAVSALLVGFVHCGSACPDPNMLGTPPLFAWGGVSCVSAFQLYRDTSYAKAAKQLKKK
jgi:hypothetical protein